ncbi:hypothetical protein CCP3SC1_810003 [Gammaproteobacteria bacterium]
MDERPTSGDGKTYLEELALSLNEINEAHRAGMVVVEVMVPASVFTKPLYKPAAVDAFDENTHFRPHTNDDKPFGWTVSLRPGLAPHHELNSESVPL